MISVHIQYCLEHFTVTQSKVDVGCYSTRTSGPAARVWSWGSTRLTHTRRTSVASTRTAIWPRNRRTDTSSDPSTLTTSRPPRLTSTDQLVSLFPLLRRTKGLLDGSLIGSALQKLELPVVTGVSCGFFSIFLLWQPTKKRVKRACKLITGLLCLCLAFVS